MDVTIGKTNGKAALFPHYDDRSLVCRLKADVRRCEAVVDVNEVAIVLPA